MRRVIETRMAGSPTRKNGHRHRDFMHDESLSKEIDPIESSFLITLPAGGRTGITFGNKTNARAAEQSYTVFHVWLHIIQRLRTKQNKSCTTMTTLRLEFLLTTVHQSAKALSRPDSAEALLRRFPRRSSQRGPTTAEQACALFTNE